MTTETTLPGTPSIKNSCTPHRQHGRFHILFEDFVEICDDDVCNAHALRAFENATNQRIKWLYERYSIPESHLPHNDDLWIEMPLRALEVLTLKAQCKSTYARTLADQAPEDTPPSLIEQGYIRRRFIARAGDDLVTKPNTMIFKDSDGEFIVVDQHGDYMGDDGTKHSAIYEGYSRISRQYLYCIEKINEAIAALDGLKSQALPRWKPMIQRRRKEEAAITDDAQETTIPPRSSDDATEDDAIPQGARRSTSPRTPVVQIVSSTSENNTEFAGLSTNPTKGTRMEHCDDIVLQMHHNAAWLPETIIGLSSLVLAVPPRPADDDAEMMHQWIVDWLEPAQRLYAATSMLSPMLAWERIDLTERYMATPGSPSWWQRDPTDPRGGRKNKVPITLKNVADRYLSEYAEFRESQWWPGETTPYDGPTILYEQGYTGSSPGVEEPRSAPLDDGNVVDGSVVTELPQVGTEPTTETLEAVPAVRASPIRRPPRGLRRWAADDLMQRIHAEYPELRLAYGDLGNDRFVVGIEYAADEWHDIDSIGAWLYPSPETARRIVYAQAYSKAMAARDAPSGSGDATQTMEETT